MQVNHPPTLVTTDLSVPLFAANGTVVGDILAYDPDRNDTLSFSLLRGEQNGVADSVILSAFVVDALSGTLTLVNDHLFEVYRGNVSLLVLVMDDGFPSLNTSGLVTVHFTQPTVLPSYLFRISDLYIPENNAEHTCFDEAVVLLDASFSDVQYTVLSPLFTLESNGTFCVIRRWTMSRNRVMTFPSTSLLPPSPFPLCSVSLSSWRMSMKSPSCGMSVSPFLRTRCRVDGSTLLRYLMRMLDRHTPSLSPGVPRRIVRSE